jgi:O-acetylhomoserine (thiol)-lyase
VADAKFLKPDTLALHAGQHPDPVTGARAVPIYQTTSFVFRDVDHAASLFNLEVGGHIYSRISNPTVAVFEERVAALEEGSGALGVASGQAALHIAIATLMGAGNHIVASTSLYGGTRNMLALTLPRFGIETTFVNPRDHDGFRKAITPETRLVLGETIGNPGGEVLDIPAIAAIAHAAKIPLMIDNTFASPVLCRPLTLGADIVFHSATKFIGGHGVAIGGVIVESGRFDWEGSGKFPTLTEPYAGYHGIDFAEEFGPHAFVLRARTEGVRDFGSCMAPQTAFICCRAWRPCRCAWRATSRMPARSSPSSRPIPRSSASPRRSCLTIPTMRWPKSSCPRARARSSASTSRAGAKPAGVSSSG